MRHGTHLAQVLALQPLGDGSHRVDVDPPGLAPEPQDLLDHPGVVLDRVGVGHGEDSRVTAYGRGTGAGEDGFGALAAWLAQVGVQVDQARQRHQALQVMALGA